MKRERCDLWLSMNPRFCGLFVVFTCGNKCTVFGSEWTVSLRCVMGSWNGFQIWIFRCIVVICGTNGGSSLGGARHVNKFLSFSCSFRQNFCQASAPKPVYHVETPAFSLASLTLYGHLRDIHGIFMGSWPYNWKLVQTTSVGYNEQYILNNLMYIILFLLK